MTIKVDYKKYIRTAASLVCLYIKVLWSPPYVDKGKMSGDADEAHIFSHHEIFQL